jgi:hypothetical protein
MMLGHVSGKKLFSMSGHIAQNKSPKQKPKRKNIQNTPSYDRKISFSVVLKISAIL